MKFILINSPSSHAHPLVRDMAGGFGLDSGDAMILPPLDLLYLAAILREKGHDVIFIEADGRRLSPEEAALAARDAGEADAVACTLSLNTMDPDAAFMRGLRRFHKGKIWIRTDIPHPPLLQEILEKSRADAIVSTSDPASAEAVLTGRSRAGSYWIEAEMLRSEPDVESLNPDQTPFPARDLVEDVRYRYPLLGEPVTTVKSSWGCPYPCGYYCPYPAIEGRKWRPRSAESVVRELEEIVRARGLRKVLFRDATFTLDKQRAKAICRGIIDKKLDLEWWCETRIDCLDEELLDLMRRAGLAGMNVGVESGDEALRQGSLKTGVTGAKLEWFMEAARRQGIKQHFLMTAGLPGETRETLLHSFEMLMRLKPDTFHFTFATPYPGTPLFQEARKRGWIASADWSRYGAADPVMRSDRLSVDELVFGRDRLMALRPLLTSGGDGEAAIARLHAQMKAWAQAPAPQQRDGKQHAPAPAARTTPKTPVISVVVPSYNRVGSVLGLAEGLARQTLAPDFLEVILVHDGPADFEAGHWPEVRRRLPGARLIAQEHRGPAAARNRGLRAARGEIALFIDDDTTPAPDLLERHLAFHRAHPAKQEAFLGLATWAPHLDPTPFMRWLEESGRQFAYDLINDPSDIAEPYRFFATCNLSLKKEFLLDAGGFDEDFPYAVFEDIELGYRLSRNGLKMTYNPGTVVHHVRPIGFKDFNERTRRAGWSAALLLRKHPELASWTYPNLLNPASLIPQSAWRELLSSVEGLKPETKEDLALCAATLDRTYLEGFMEGAQALGLSGPALLKAVAAQWDAQARRAFSPQPPSAAPSRTPAAPNSPARVKSGMFSIVIVNFDGMRYLPECLEALRAQTYAGGREIIVVNNKSTDGSLDYLRGQTDVRLIDPGVNTGFSKGQNMGILASRGEYVLCLNFDCFLEPRFLEKAAATFSLKPEIGAVSGKLKKLIDHKKSDVLDSTGIAFRRCVPADRGEWLSDGPQWNQGGPIFGPSGAAACYRRAALEDARFKDEFFDEDMFIYCEDIDLAWRMNLRGWRSWYAPEAVAYHERGSTRKSSEAEKRNYFIKGFRNRFLGLYKNLRWTEDIRPNWKAILSQEARFILGFVRKDLDSAIIMLTALLETAYKIACRRRVRDKRSFIHERLGNNTFRLDFDDFQDALLGPHIDVVAPPAEPGKVLCEFKSVKSRNLSRFRVPKNEMPAVRKALSYGISKARDPQFIVSIPEGAGQYCRECLEVDLFSSQASSGQVIWLYKSEFCVSENFMIHPGRRRYLIDLGTIKVLGNAGNPTVRNHPDKLRIDPAHKNGVLLGIFSMNLVAKQGGARAEPSPVPA